jgi:hypothetical protein
VLVIGRELREDPLRALANLFISSAGLVILVNLQETPWDDLGVQPLRVAL